MFILCLLFQQSQPLQVLSNNKDKKVDAVPNGNGGHNAKDRCNSFGGVIDNYFNNYNTADLYLPAHSIMQSKPRCVGDLTVSRQDVIAKYGNISDWDTSEVTDMSYVFYHKNEQQLDQLDLSKWNTSGVTTVRSMFMGAHHFNGNLSTWNTTNVLCMDTMFAAAKSFNGDLSRWNTGNVISMHATFAWARVFQNDISKWDVGRVGTMDAMFLKTSHFQLVNLSLWNVANVRDMTSMFKESAFNGDLSGWNVTKVTSMRSMFAHASFFNGDISKWDVSNVTTLDQSKSFLANC